MAAEENRLAHFRRLVESLAPAGKDGKPVLREGYRAVADASGVTYDYIYQLYNEKSGKKGLGASALKKISAAFGEGKPDNWMDLPLDDAEAAGSAVRTEHELGQLSPQLRQLLIDLDDIPESKRSRLIDHIHQVAEEAREAAEHHESKKKTTAAALKKGAGKSSATVSYGDGNTRQRPLPWATGIDPFTATPDEREGAWYRQLEKAGKDRE